MITGKRSALLWHVLTSVYARLGFDALGDAAFAQLVLARIVEPTSKADSLRVLEEIGVEHASLRTMFRSLQRAASGGYRAQVATACFTHAAAGGDVSLCLYDVTTLYFEAENEDELRKVGYSKERRVDPQIVVGLLVDRKGFPLEIGAWEGNKAETSTMIPIIRQFQARHDLSTWSSSPTPGCSPLQQPHRPRRGRAAVHRRLPRSEGTGRPGQPLPLARGRVHRRAADRHHHPAGGHQDRPGAQRRQQARRAGVGPGRAHPVLAGGVGLLPPNAPPGTARP